MANEFTVARDDGGVFTLRFGDADVTEQIARMVVEIGPSSPKAGTVRLEIKGPISLDLMDEDFTGVFDFMSNEQLKEVRDKLDGEMHKRMEPAYHVQEGQ